jgi:hypothetical protein
MHLFLDEPGDLGFDFDIKNPSKKFVITILVAGQQIGIKSAVNRTLKNKLRQKKKGRFIKELKGANTTMEIKQYFYRQISRQDDWFLQTIILDKASLLNNKSLIANKNRIYNILSKNILDGIDAVNNSAVAHLYVDKSKTVKEMDVFNTYIRSNLESNMPVNATLNIAHLDSHNNAGLQAVDMFCYGIARKYELNDAEWYNIFSSRIQREIIFRL